MNKTGMALLRTDFLMNGFNAIVDGQYGSTGKGLLASVLAEHLGHRVQFVTSNAGPNSGHTSYYKGEKVVLRQLPTFSVMNSLYGRMTTTVINAGAIIDPVVLHEEIIKYGKNMGTVFLNQYAALVSESNQKDETKMIERIGSTGKGTGSALSRKIMREPDAVLGSHCDNPKLVKLYDGGVYLYEGPLSSMMEYHDSSVLAEVSQGFSLSLNAGGFYPHCTSRDCTVAQAMSDAGVHPSTYRDCAMVVRTYPIRVAGNSGGCYRDQEETDWATLGVEPEVTTVTKKIRRVFTWSTLQFKHALAYNRPSILMVNFMNYLPRDVNQHQWVIDNVYIPYTEVMKQRPKLILLGYGPRNEDVKVFEK